MINKIEFSGKNIPHKTMTPDNLLTIEKLHKMNVSASEIARMTGYAYSTIKHRISGAKSYAKGNISSVKNKQTTTKPVPMQTPTPSNISFDEEVTLYGKYAIYSISTKKDSVCSIEFSRVDFLNLSKSEIIEFTNELVAVSGRLQ